MSNFIATAIPLVTTEGFPTRTITQTLGLVTSYGCFEQEALHQLVEQAQGQGADAVVALRLSTAAVEDGYFATAYGTAVKLDQPAQAD